MRPIISAVCPPPVLALRGRLDQLHGRFCEELEGRATRVPDPTRLAVLVGKLSEIYNHRSADNSYNRPELIDARRHFFMPTDMVKLWPALAELLPWLTGPRRGPLRVLDLGAGTGTAAAGLVLLLAAAGYEGDLELVMVEPDQTVGRQLGPTCEALERVTGRRFAWRWEHRSLADYLESGRKRADRFDLVTAVDLMLELYPPEGYADGLVALVPRLLEQCLGREGALLLVEPALLRVSRPLSMAGDRLRREGLALVAPCVAPNCPQLDRRDGFCFHSVKVPLTPLLQSISARSGLDRHEVNYSYLSFAKGGQPPLFAAPGCAPAMAGTIPGRVISFPRRVKKGFNYHLCTASGLQVAFAPRLVGDDALRGGRLHFGARALVTGGECCARAAAASPPDDGPGPVEADPPAPVEQDCKA